MWNCTWRDRNILCSHSIHGIPSEEELERENPPQGAREDRFTDPTPQLLHTDGQRWGANVEVKYEKSPTSMENAEVSATSQRDLRNRKDFHLRQLSNALCECSQVL